MVGLPLAGVHWAWSMYESGKAVEMVLRFVKALKGMGAEAPQEAGNPPEGPDAPHMTDQQ